MAKPLPLLVACALALSSVGCCKKGSDSSQGAAPAETTAAGATTTAPAPAPSPASTAPAPLDPAKKAQLVALFEKNKAGIDKCTPIHKDMMKAQASKDVPTMVLKSQQFVACRNGWVSGLMPKITPLGITEDQAKEEMMTWDNARKKLGRVAARAWSHEGLRGDRPAHEQVRACRRTCVESRRLARRPAGSRTSQAVSPHVRGVTKACEATGRLANK